MGSQYWQLMIAESAILFPYKITKKLPNFFLKAKMLLSSFWYLLLKPYSSLPILSIWSFKNAKRFPQKIAKLCNANSTRIGSKKNVLPKGRYIMVYEFMKNNEINEWITMKDSSWKGHAVQWLYACVNQDVVKLVPFD